MKRWSWILITTVVTLGASATYLRERTEAATPRVLTSAVTQGPVAATVDATGTLQPVDTVEVGTQVSGTIETLRADFNSIVRKGQIIATLDPAVLRSQVAQADATVARLRAEADRARVAVVDAEQKLSRARTLSEQELLPRTELDAAVVASDAARAAVRSADAQVQQAQAALDQARVALSHTVIVTPVDGVVLSRNVEVGQTVSAGLQAPTLFVIARDLATMQLDANIDEADIGRITPGQPARFTVDAYGDEGFTGTLRQIRLQPTVVQNVVTYTAVIDVPNAGHRLKPGMTATVSIETARADDVLRVPAAALRFRPSETLVSSLNPSTSSARAQEPRSRPAGPHVWTLVDGHLRPVAVRAGIGNASVVEVAGDGLAAGMLVVTGVAGAAAEAPSTGSPLMPSFPRRGGNGGQRATSRN